MPRQDETVPGGRYIVGARYDPNTGKHMGGTVRDANGKILAEFESNEENTGKPKGEVTKDEPKPNPVPPPPVPPRPPVPPVPPPPVPPPPKP